MVVDDTLGPGVVITFRTLPEGRWAASVQSTHIQHELQSSDFTTTKANKIATALEELYQKTLDAQGFVKG